MSSAWVTVIVLALATGLIRASGPVLLGGRNLPRPFGRVIVLVAPALLAALVVTETFSEDGGLVLDERAAGVAAAGLTLAWRDSLLWAGGVAIVVTAALRALL